VGTEQLTDGERIIRLETELIAVKDAIFRIEKMLLMREESYWTKEVIENKFQMRDKEIEVIKKEIDSIKDEKKTHKSVLPLWIAIVPSVVLVVFEIINLAHK
jgi:hypothetical protein